MTRASGLIVLLIALGLTAVIIWSESTQLGPWSASFTQADREAVAVGAASLFKPVAGMLQVQHAETGTYVGARVPAGSGVLLARATDAAYCLQGNLNGRTVHEIGPGGLAEPGRC